MKIVTLTEQDLNRIIDRVINEQSIPKPKSKYVSNQVIYRDNKKDGTYSGYGYWYQGTPKKFVRNGYGRMKWVDGDVYEGQWKYDKLNGYGRYKWSDGDVYEGNFLNGKKHGKGTYKWTEGDVYKGEHKNDKESGYGELTWEDGSYYKGKWKNGKTNGYGTYVNKYKIEFSGTWVDGKLDGKNMDDLDKITTEQPKSPTNNQKTSNQTTTKSDASTSTCPQPTEPQYNYVGDNNYQYAKSGDCWWAFRKSNSKWINLTERLKTNPGYQSTIDNLNNGGTNLTPITPSSEEETTPLG